MIATTVQPIRIAGSPWYVVVRRHGGVVTTSRMACDSRAGAEALLVVVQDLPPPPPFDLMNAVKAACPDQPCAVHRWRPMTPADVERLAVQLDPRIH